MKSDKALFRVALTCLLVFSVISLIYAQIQGPKDFTYEGKTMGNVVYSHKIHAEAQKMECKECHTAIFKMKKGTSGMTNMEAMDKGEFCGTCHNGTRAFDLKLKENCGKCHQPKSGEEPETKE